MNTAIFIADIKRELAIRGWKYKDLAVATGYTPGVIKQFMSGNYPYSSHIIKAISKALNIVCKTDDTALQTHYNTSSVQKSVQK